MLNNKIAGAVEPKVLNERKELNVLLLCDYKPAQAATVVEHINAIFEYSRHKIDVVSGLIENGGDLPKSASGIDFPLMNYDVLVIHYSLTLAIDSYINSHLKKRISAFRGVKVVFIQDEYRFVDRTVNSLNEIGANLLFSCVPDEGQESIYPASKLPGLKVINCLTGYVPPTLLALEKPLALKKRKKHVVYRGRQYPAWHGRLGVEKWLIAKEFLKYKKRNRPKLKVDISYREKDRVYGDRWLEFLKSSRAVLAVESGCSVFDYDGRISTGSELYHDLLDLDIEKDYPELKNRFFEGQEDVVDLAQLSPRIFEAVCLGVINVGYEGNYSGVLKPWVHYVPVKKDHSNWDEVVKFLKDDKKCAAMIVKAYTDIAMSEEYSYETFVRKVDEEIENVYNQITSDLLSKVRETQIVNLSGYDTSFKYVKYPHHHHAIFSFSKLLSVHALLRKILPRSVFIRLKNIVRKFL